MDLCVWKSSQTRHPHLARVNGWSRPLHLFQGLVWAMMFILALTVFGIFIPFLPPSWNLIAYGVSFTVGAAPAGPPPDLAQGPAMLAGPLHLSHPQVDTLFYNPAPPLHPKHAPALAMVPETLSLFSTWLAGWGSRLKAQECLPPACHLCRDSAWGPGWRAFRVRQASFG